jgi:hypothetical protein
VLIPLERCQAAAKRHGHTLSTWHALDERLQMSVCEVSAGRQHGLPFQWAKNIGGLEVQPLSKSAKEQGWQPGSLRA